MKNLLLIVTLVLSLITNAQNLSIPDSILADLNPVTFIEKTDTLNFQVVYPKDYDSTKTYPIYLALSGGNQSLQIVNYCYAAWFKSKYFENYITILPLAKNGKNMRNYNEEDITNTIRSIQNNLNSSSINWIIGGTSNGGVAVFKFLDVNPALFSGAIVIPGMLKESIPVSEKWQHLEILLAYGSKDSRGWKKGTKKTKKLLSSKVKSVQVFQMKKQGHILPLSYNIDLVYDTFFQVK